MSEFGRVTVTGILDYDWFSVRATRLWQERGSNPRPQAEKYTDYANAPPLFRSFDPRSGQSWVAMTLKISRVWDSWSNLIMTVTQRENESSLISHNFVMTRSLNVNPPENSRQTQNKYSILMEHVCESIYNNT